MKTLPIKFIVHFPQDDVFKNVSIKGGVSYYLIDNCEQYTGKTLFNGMELNINDYDIILEPIYYKLIKHLDTNKYFERNLSELYTSQGKFITNKLEKELTRNKTTNSILCYAAQAKGFKNYIEADKITTDYKYWKVITTAAAHGGTSGFGNIFIGTDEEIHSRSYISFKVNSKLEADSLYSYLKCKITQVLLSSRKLTHNISGNTVLWIPIVPFDRIWTENDLYKYFNLSEEHIHIINNIQIDGSYDK
jgi:site-specific DNA-methyltransferase (adenine-specific)